MVRAEIEHTQTIDDVFAARLKAARSARGLTQKALAELLSVDRAVIARLEGGAKRPTVRELFAIAAELNVAPIHLVMPLEDDAPVEVAGRVMSASNARAWTRGTRLLRGADIPAFTRQMPDRELRALIEAVMAQGVDPVTWALIDPAKREAGVRELMDAIRSFTREEEDDG